MGIERDVLVFTATTAITAIFIKGELGVAAVQNTTAYPRRAKEKIGRKKSKDGLV